MQKIKARRLKKINSIKVFLIEQNVLIVEENFKVNGIHMAKKAVNVLMFNKKYKKIFLNSSSLY